jgi:hypothetical protein
MPPNKPTHADAELVLKLYDLRREALMRESRAKILRWIPQTFEDVRAITDFQHPDNAAWRQVSSYFEYAFGFARHGIVPPDFLAEYNGEGLLLFAKIEPFLAQFRAEIAPTAFGNSEWVVQNSAFARERLELLRMRLTAMQANAAAARTSGNKRKKKDGKKPSKSKVKRSGR